MPEIPPKSPLPPPELPVPSPSPREGISSNRLGHTFVGPELSTTDSVSVVINYPNQPIYKCPFCSICYSIYTSWTRHLKVVHSSHPIGITFKCNKCPEESENRHSISAHYTKAHGQVPTERPYSTKSGGLKCDFCNKYYPTKRSLGQHIRNQHGAEASEV